jgi:hypothetical protein
MVDVADNVAEVIHVLETAVHGGKTDVGDLVEFLQLVHHLFSNLARGDFALTQGQQALTDSIDGGIDQFGRHRTLVQRTTKAFAQLGLGKILAGAVGLDDLRRPQLCGFPGGETLVAGGAAAAPTNCIARLVDA